MHLYDFIVDDTQYDLKEQARNTNFPFERHLLKYQGLFFEGLSSTSVSEQSKFLHPSLQSNPEVNQWFSDFHDLIRKAIRDFELLFDNIREVYQIFLSGNHQTAVTYFYHLLEKFDLLDDSYADLLGGFLRGRKFTDRSDIMEGSFYYHVSFWLRFLIQNQRFSFSGHPLLYAGQSLISVFYELGAKSLNDEDIAVSLVGFDHMARHRYGKGWEKMKGRSKIFDITNSIYEIVNDTFFRILELKLKIPRIENGPGFPERKIVRAFRKFILSHLCTFPRIPHSLYDKRTDTFKLVEHSYFVEEYALPQLLTQAVRWHKYNGIIYPSTKFIHKKIEYSTDWHSNIYRTNLAMFTEYDVTGKSNDQYDRELFEVLQIDVIDFRNLKGHGYTIRSIKKMNAFQVSEGLLGGVQLLEKRIAERVPYSEASDKLRTVLYHIQKKVTLYRALTIEGDAYLSTLAGRMELIYLMQYFGFIRNQLRTIYREELEDT